MGMLAAAALASSSLSLKSTTGHILFSPVASLTFDSKPTTGPHARAILQSSPLVDASNPKINQNNPTVTHNGTLVDEATPKLTHHASSLSNGTNTQILQSTHDQASPLPAIRPPTQLSLDELLRHDFENARNFPEAICNAADTLITQFLSPAELLPSVDPQVQLIGNCAPVAETPPTPCSVVGKLPSDLNGAYLRNGPNATYLHRGEGWHDTFCED
ncbi:hypothetical protein GOP47_0005469 [Adiantum capillus-veneris]|uniref:Uncharacterized protein n=1 Tax=Adiantum capillus-veneris TaxID=13818 RepID=A0A9D4ZP57_ADICA|nr:hypothetical protein GOP47_0005469 [Adiantum capillus-veneris]